MLRLPILLLLLLTMLAVAACGQGTTAPAVAPTGGATSETEAPAAAGGGGGDETEPVETGETGTTRPVETGRAGAVKKDEDAGTTTRDRTGSGPGDGETMKMGAPDTEMANIAKGMPGLDSASMTRLEDDGPGMPGSAVPEHSWPKPTPGSDPWLPPERQGPRSALKAGEVDDNKRWEEYLGFVQEYSGPSVHETNLEDRQVVRVMDREGNPVPNARVTLSLDGKELATNLTYADGRTLFFPQARGGQGMTMTGGGDDTELSLEVSRNGFTKELTVSAGQERNYEIRLDGRMDYGEQVDLDVLFLLDSTGSMADEIRQIKTTLDSIAQRVSRLPQNPDLRFAMVSYRDRGDEYVTRLFDFDANVRRFSETIRNVRADGGGDYPESLNQALHEAVNDVSWKRDSVRLIFLIADAPPHLDYSQDEDYAVEMVRAREQGIKVFSTASSGLDEQGEYIFRQIAQQTMGRFLFILYESGPQGELDTPHSVEQYSVDRLDDLIVGLIEEELAALGPGQQGGMELK